VKAIRDARRESLHQERLDELAALGDEPGDVPEIIHGDSLQWLQKRPSESVPFIVTDPPFGLGVKYDGFADPKTPDEYIQWFRPLWSEMKRVLVPGGSLVVCQALKYLRHFWDWYGPDIFVTACITTVRSQIMWYPIVRWVSPGAVSLSNRVGNDALMMNSSEPDRNKYLAAHPCPKTVRDCRVMIEAYTLPGALVVDPFAGLGSFGLACRETGRAYIGIEQSRKYVTIARRRYRALTQ
jgi:site-specific DNA-methyltransferase (adenine-specific)